MYRQSIPIGVMLDIFYGQSILIGVMADIFYRESILGSFWMDTRHALRV